MCERVIEERLVSTLSDGESCIISESIQRAIKVFATTCSATKPLAIALH